MNRVGRTDRLRALRGTVQHRRRRWVRPSVSVLEDRMMLAAYTVISDADTNIGNPATETGTLRWAINQLDANRGPSSTIAFDLPSNELTITPGTAGLGPLPSITEPVDIEGQTQPNFAGKPLVVINGGSAGSNASGLTLGAGSSNSVIQDLVIDGFAKNGIQIDSSGDQVEGCYVGTDASGTVAVPNSAGGISVFATGATIGGTASGDANVISGNGFDGILIGATDCLVAGNEIGTDAAGTAAVANSGDGILVESSNATIGGTASGDANVISGNGSYGVDIEATDCLVAGNEIGTDAGGTAAVANSFGGIYVGASGATIGGTASGDANLISGNGRYGIVIDASDCLVAGNDIGTDAAGTAAVPNADAGIDVFATGATIGGTASGDANLISGNRRYGIVIAVIDCLVEGNEIGTDAAGTAAVPTPAKAYLSTHRVRRSAGRPRATPMSSPGMILRRRHLHRRDRLPGRGEQDRHQRGRHRRRGELQRWHICLRLGCDDRRDRLGRRQCHLRERSYGSTSTRRLPGRGEPDRHRCGRHRRRGERQAGISVFAIGCDDRRDRRRATPMSSPGMGRRHRHRCVRCLVEGNEIGTNAGRHRRRGERRWH